MGCIPRRLRRNLIREKSRLVNNWLNTPSLAAGWLYFCCVPLSVVRLVLSGVSEALEQGNAFHMVGLGKHINYPRLHQPIALRQNFRVTGQGARVT